ncbi:NRAMP family divalent metal transporter [Candidatus Chlorohelix allophototropha]|uniref:NRAMP family divalent metal transporter n=1 Tax=Candidatus Chlorohelix allophototropha TaxID=3003348 RepID=UPI003CE46FA4
MLQQLEQPRVIEQALPSNPPLSLPQFRLWGWLLSFGPGLMVMLADTDAGSMITAAQSGAQWGYALVFPQLALIPVLYVVQEMTIRLGIVTGKGHGALISQHFGRGWALFSVMTLFVACFGAIVTEYVGLAGVGQLFGLPPWLTVSFAAFLLIGIVLTGSYKRVERIGLAVGLFELLLIPAALLSHPDWGQVAEGASNIPLLHGDFLFLLAANVGAVIMPWMIFYQQGAVLDKCLCKTQLKAAKIDTALGAVITQLVMVAVVVAVAVGAGQLNKAGQSLNSMQDIAHTVEPVLGHSGMLLLFGMGMAGAAFLAALVVSLAASWGMGEALRIKHSLNLPVRKAKTFYGLYILSHVVGAALVLSGIGLVNLAVDIEVMNAILLPLVLGFLLILERVALPERYRMKGTYKYFAWVLCAVVILFGVYTGVNALISLF